MFRKRVSSDSVLAAGAAVGTLYIGMPVRRPDPVQFVLLRVRDDELSRMPELNSAIIELARKHNAYIQIVAGCISFAVFGVLPSTESEPNEKHRRNFVEEVSKIMRQDVAVLHGQANAFVGNTSGTRLHVSFGAILQGCREMIAELTAKMKLGDICEWAGEGSVT